MLPGVINCRTKRPPLWPVVPAVSLLLLGISAYILIYPWNSYLQLIKLSGIGILLNGLLLIAAYYTGRTFFSHSNWILAEGLLNSVSGSLMLFNPLLNFLLFSYFAGTWAIAWGGLKIAQSLFQKKILKGWQLLCAEGGCAAAVGTLLLDLPFIKTRQTIQWLALLLLLMSILNIMINLKNKTYKKGRPIMF
ncbi:Uncharacterized membrane protein HdeD, DUF308 family [Niabella drilacis]|uniref:Uncharacterized membrane protein HdeD, DUF308 family n=2 Tax=Niabella drilacis (strain DSM 25811 / CCM 8410 / CCUG 62505 / LMG 26954 / E90) TaxID=1285928 RepID=A0A1G6RF82_NIADE|nr:Uncharacterized membrane protein HdeD, DUF308 family [Niabella drilacis]